MHQADILHYILYDNHGKALIRLRLPSHRQRIESGQYDKKCPLNERECVYCNSNDDEDEYYFNCFCVWFLHGFKEIIY